MSAFEISMTPSRVKNNKKRHESREPTDVIMAPFTSKSIMQFEDVPVKKTAKRLLRIINPSECDIEVKITKFVKPQNNLSVQWTEHIIAAQSEVGLEIVWSPDEEVACKDSLQFSDNRNFRKDVTIILKSKGNKPQQQKIRKFPTVSSSVNTVVKTLRLKSPTGNIGALRVAKMQAAHVKQRKRSSQQKPANENFQVFNKMEMSNRPQRATLLPLGETNKYMVDGGSNKNSSPVKHGNKTSAAAYKEDECKENRSPLTPVLNVMSYIDRLKFTPASEKRAALDPCAGIDSLASLPTPKNCTVNMNKENIARPRRLITGEHSPINEILLLPQIIVEDVSKGLATPISNKTFDVKRNETLEISSASNMLESSIEEAIVMNKTTTIVAAHAVGTLAMIHEEEESYISSPLTHQNSRTEILQQTFKKFSAEDLKRDIHLVGTPLHKQSESMKELIFKSPNNSKIGTQGSLPNLNEMEQIRSIEQNRYFYDSQAHKRMSVIHEQSERHAANVDANDSTGADGSLMLNVSHLAESTMFVQSEICAQSSRFNMHEVGLKLSRQNSPDDYKFKQPTPLPKTSTRSESLKKRAMLDTSCSDTNSTESLSSSRRSLKISPPKKQRFDLNCSLRMTPKNAAASATSLGNASKSWSRTLPKKLKLFKKGTSSNTSIATVQEDTRLRLYDSDLYMQTCINPDPFAATTTCDPFLASTMYLDERAVEKHLKDFKKWLNALVSIPAELDANCNVKIDVAKLFNEVRHKELTLAPNKEEHSLQYHTKCRLESLRRAAVELFLSEEMRVPCSKVAVYVQKNAIRIRNDRNLHLDVVTQRTILELLLCFNPLWLRLGLEVVYGQKIPLNSNSDIYGLSTFIINRLFRDKFLEHKYHRSYTLSDEYADHIKKFTLQKLLFLLLFLDKAKQKRIVKHNPCLFVINSPHKETRSILLRMSSELLANIGDVTRDLKRLGYELEHKQTYLDEFEYAFKNLSVDLRDGIRLTRIMEIILLREDLTCKLRVPAISRLQRIHNVNLALRALAETDFVLKGDITAASIVDGHREKTLSLLWQIIYKFRSPKFHAAARVLQNWWRRCWLRVFINRRIRQRAEERRIKAATLLQAMYRGHVARKWVQQYRLQLTKTAIFMQRHIRGFLVRRRQAKLLKYTLELQRKFRARQVSRQQRARYLMLRNAAIVLQRYYRRHCCNEEQKLRRENAALAIQQFWRGYVIMKAARIHYKYQYSLIVNLQRSWRAKKCMQQQRATFIQQRELIICVQKRFRAQQLMKVQRQAFLQLRYYVCHMQQRRRALLLMREQRKNYLQQHGAIICVQKRFRAQQLMKVQRQAFLQLRYYVCRMQQRRRALLLMCEQRTIYLQQRGAIIVLQNYWRATLKMKLERASYLNAYECICKLQRRWVAKLKMKQQQRIFIKTKQLIIMLQRKWRATLKMRKDKAAYNLFQHKVLHIQRLYRAKIQMRQERENFKMFKKNVINVQQRYRAKLQMRAIRAHFKRQQQAAVVLQRRLRAYKQMRFDRAKYQGTRAAVLCLQQHIRGYLNTRKVRAEYLRAHQLIVWVQRRYLATRVMRQVRKQYLQHRSAIIFVQRQYRACLLRKKQNEAAVCIQRWYRSILRMRGEMLEFRKQREAALVLQHHWRAILKARDQRKIFQNTLQHIVAIQRKWRATKEMHKVKQDFNLLRSSTIVLQRKFRSWQYMLQVRNQYLLIRSLIICIQRKFRARQLMLQERQAFLKLRHYTLHLQQKWRGKPLMLQQRNSFMQLRLNVIIFQAHARGNLARRRFQELMTPAMVELLRQKKAAKVIQRYWRGYRVRRRLYDTRLQHIRKNIAELKKTSNIVNSVRCKVQDSVGLLRGRFSAAEALQVLIRLERLSRMVPHLLMCHSSFISTFSYGIMAQAIRSEVDKKLIEHCSRIILNLARYNSTTANTFQKSGLVTIAQMLLRWCDKDCEIFNTLCTLIWIFAHCPKKRKIIREFMTTPDTIYMVRETRKLVARKEKMKQNVRKPSSLSVGVGWSLPQQQQQQQPTFPKRSFPSLQPDYGVIKGKPYTFVSSVFAFDTVLSKLEIDNI